MKNKAVRMFTATLAAVLCMAAVSVIAYVGGVDLRPQPLPEETEKPTTGGIEMEPEDVPVTPKGNVALVDNFFGDKQLITVTTKTGNYLYILIDRANKDKGMTVHSLNQVDDADLRALLKDGEIKLEHCTCTTKCEAGAINTNCPVCKNNMNAYTGPEPEKYKPEEAKPQEEEPNGIDGLVVFLAVVLADGGAALYSFKFRKSKADIRGGDDLDEYDLGEDEDDEEEAPEPDDTQEPGEDWLIEREAPGPNKEDEK